MTKKANLTSSVLVQFELLPWDDLKRKFNTLKCSTSDDPDGSVLALDMDLWW